jgi:hypothetical protein
MGSIPIARSTLLCLACPCVARGARPFQVAGERNTNYGAYSAMIERIALHDNYGENAIKMTPTCFLLATSR